jgi:hypothetical protein
VPTTAASELVLGATPACQLVNLAAAAKGRDAPATRPDKSKDISPPSADGGESLPSSNISNYNNYC